MAGKNAGNFAESASFCENLSRKHMLIQLFARKFPVRRCREFFRASRELIPPFRPEQGIWREIHPYAQPRQRSALADKIIINESIKLKRARSPMPQGELP
jgi:hypothetical protein